MKKHNVDRALFSMFPGLWEKIPFVPLATLPTPLERMDKLSTAAGAEIWFKRDGQSHPVYGGNKMRRFEFIFGDVLRKGAKAVLTGGGLGSNHNLATGVVAHAFGLQAVCTYYCQPITEEVLTNLRRSATLDIDMHFCGDYVGLTLCFIAQYIRWWARTGRPPYFIYPGAPETLGVLGYVNAALELKQQLNTLEVPDPDAVFVAAGSCGTLAGLILGARLGGLKSHIIGVQIIESDVANREKVARMVNKAARYLRKRDARVPPITIDVDEISLLDTYLGRGYAHATDAAKQAVDLVRKTEERMLETTYTGKTMAALLDYADAHPGARLLFVDTLAEAPTIAEGNWQKLPRTFWQVFDRAYESECRCLRSRRDPDFCWKRKSDPTLK